MDPFTQRMLEKAEQRSRALGICNADNFTPPPPPVTTTATTTTTVSSTGNAGNAVVESDALQCADVTTMNSVKKIPVVERKVITASNSSNPAAGAGPQKVLRQFSAVDKENLDLGIEINVMTRDDIEVEVHVEQNEFNDEDHPDGKKKTHHQPAEPLARIRDTSRSRLQRLGALYSNTNDLSSPIHRTEGQFHADTMEDTNAGDNAGSKRSKPKQQRYGKLAALADSINQWEDDLSHPNVSAQPATAVAVVPPPKPALPSRNVSGQQNQQHQQHKKDRAPLPPITATTTKPLVPNADLVDNEDEAANKTKTKQIKWDPKIINSLEVQGFQRRESSTVRYEYDYNKEKDEDQEEEQPRGKVASLALNLNKQQPEAGAKGESKPESVPAVRPGLVSGRAAAFESKAASASNQLPQKPQKDPTELSLKERMQLFERNKGEALVPKAPFGLAPPISKMRPEANKVDNNSNNNRKEDKSLMAKATGLRDKVAALVNATTISESKIREEINKQRQEDMQVLANRFNRQKQLAAKDRYGEESKAQEESLINATTEALTASSKFMRPPPPPPPPPTAISLTTTKRRSRDAIDDDTKRARTSTEADRIYPTLSDFDSHDSEEDHCGTTVTASADETPHEHDRLKRSRNMQTNSEDDDIDDENDKSCMESENDDSSAGICNGSLGREIMQVVQKNVHQQQQTPRPAKGVHYSNQNQYYDISPNRGEFDSSLNSSDASMGVDDYLDEALGENEDGDDDFTQESGDDYEEHNGSRASRGSQGTTASNSFCFRKTLHSNQNYQAINEERGQSAASSSSGAPQPVTSELQVNEEKDNNLVTLVHTVSFYRRQQNSANSTPVRKICREQQVLRSVVENVANAARHFEQDAGSHRPLQGQLDFSDDGGLTQTDDEDEDIDNNEHLVQEKIKKLLDEVHKQQQIIGQTSQALNLCAATVEFSGSTESVEGERHLLVATHRRQACLDEVQRLRVEKSLRPLGAPSERGRLTVKEITVPLRQDYIRKLAADTISGHHLVCLLKYNEHVLATRTVPTLPGLLAVKFPDVLQMNNVYADFKITLEIYGMTAQREVLPHEVKYHINLNKKSGIKTPKKKGSENRLVMPPVQSPAGPNVVRTPALVQYGFAIFSLREIQRTTWTLTQVLGVSPLDGVVHMKVSCELSVSVEYKGFLTMFEDISGLGAWHRRWCHLNGTVLNYWKYPDDEKKKAPLGSIDLYTCSSQKVTTAPRDICARLHTMLLETTRPAKDTDKESLIIRPQGRSTVVRHLLSADTKDEREEWCAYFNKALTLLRAWGPPQ